MLAKLAALEQGEIRHLLTCLLHLPNPCFEFALLKIRLQIATEIYIPFQVLHFKSFPAHFSTN